VRGDLTRTHEREVKGALRKAPLAEPFFASRYSFSPYMACGHGCAYCDGRAERYWVEGEFDRDIVVRTNIAECLDCDLAHARERAPVSVGSGISDAYQPVEERLGLMRGTAEILLRHRFPASVLTKSSLVRRDLDVWRAVNDEAGFTLSVSLVFADDGERAIFEPGASPVADRVAALRAFKEAGCGVGVYAMPLLPWIADSGEALRRLLDLCRAAGVDFVIPGGLTLRPGRQKDFFLARLAASHPELVPRYRELYGENRSSGAGRPAYGREAAARFARADPPPALPRPAAGVRRAARAALPHGRPVRRPRTGDGTAAGGGRSVPVLARRAQAGVQSPQDLDAGGPRG
jgi:DNA repair photolyase